MTLKVQVVPVTPYQQNCSIIQCQVTGHAAIVDPGGDIERIEAAITKMNATVEKILLTHGHLDHCAAADVLRQPFTPDRWLEDGDTVTVGEQTLEVIHCPGHTPGHVVFLHRETQLAWVGDVIFAGSIGRTDFPMGNHEQLIHSIREKLFPIGDDIRFVPGHGPDSTFGQERASNPFVADTQYG